MKFFLHGETVQAHLVIWELVTVRNEVVKVMFLHLSVCPHGGSASVHTGIPPRSRYPLEQTPPQSTHTPGTRHPPGPEAPWDQAPPCQDQAPPGPGTPQQTATVADGMHPTGMHSCLIEFLLPANEVCEGYVFTGVCLSTGGMHACPQGMNTPRSCIPLWYAHPLGTHTPRHAHTPRHTCPPRHTHPPNRYYEMWSISGWYTSYWDTFLFLIIE